jgi:hypothetical protein
VYLRRPWRDLPADTWIEVPSPATDPFRATVDGFADAMRENRSAPVGARDAVAALDFVLRLYASAPTATGRPS